MMPPTLDDIRAAMPNVYSVLAPSPLQRHPLLAEALGADVYVKHENHNPTGAFKVRGGVNLVARLSRGRSRTRRDLGDHRQSRPVDRLCLPARRRALHAGGAARQQPREERPDARLGADLIEHGKDFDEARELVERLCDQRGLRYVHSANEPDLISGVGTYALEVFEALADIDVVFVPIGGGSGACGLITVRDALGSRRAIVGVGAERADAVGAFLAHGNPNHRARRPTRLPKASRHE